MLLKGEPTDQRLWSVQYSDNQKHFYHDLPNFDWITVIAKLSLEVAPKRAMR